MGETSEAAERALTLAQNGPAYGPNPRVGCVLLAGEEVIGEGWHCGAGMPHAEVAALADAARRGQQPQGATAVVTLEPCAHTGRTGPCTEALQAAGIAQVYYALADPGPKAGGGTAQLSAMGVRARLWSEVWPSQPNLVAQAKELVRYWYHAMVTGRPWVTVKTATSLDGRVAARDGTSHWITGPQARAHAHLVRSQVDAIAITTGTALADNPRLSARTGDGGLADHQPLRVVIGYRDLPARCHLSALSSAETGGDVLHLRTHDVGEVLAKLAEFEVRHLLVEGGPALVTALLAAQVVDEFHAYLAPMVLGDGPGLVRSFGVTTLADAPRWRTREVRWLGEDVLVVAARGQED